jgi:hypothetical protein
MGRYINTALGPRWTDEPMPEPGHLQYPSSALHALGRIAGKVDHALAMAEQVGESPLPTPTAEDIQFLAESLAEDRSWLPHGSHVETVCLDTSTPLQKPYGPVYTNTATSISIPIIGTFTPRELLETGLVTKGGKFQAHVYERLLSEVDGVVKGRLIGPRDLMLAVKRLAAPSTRDCGPMARPTVTIPPATILMEMAGYGCLTEWLARPLPKEHVAKLSPDAHPQARSGQAMQAQG